MTCIFETWPKNEVEDNFMIYDNYPESIQGANLWIEESIDIDFKMD